MIRKRKEVTEEQALERMMVACSRSELCSFDVATKLKRLGLSADKIKNIVNKLTRECFIDDARFSAAYAYTKMIGNGWGRAKIKMGLYQKRITSKLISEALENLDERKYYDTLMLLARGKARYIDLKLYEDRQKLFRSLYLRGFETELIKRVISQLLKEESDQDD